MNAPEPKAAAVPVGESMLLQVRAIRLEATGIHSFELVDAEGGLLPAISAGAHVDVHLPGGLVRSYSLAGDPHDRTRWTLGVLKEAQGRGGSRAMHSTVHVGDSLRIGSPRNAFALHEDADHSILLAGGIGITPLKSMAHHLAAHGHSFELHYCVRTVRNAAFLQELRSLIPAERLHLHFDGGDPAKGLDIAGLLREQRAGSHLYYCGPSGFMQAVGSASAHWSPGSVHFEHFTAPVRESSSIDEDGPFDVVLARSGATIHVEAGQTIVRAVELTGRRIPTSCLSGLCGSCKVDYVEGEVDHRDFILSDDERSRCLTTCVSRSRSAKLVLDL